MVFLVLFFFSGACGLTYEVVWMRMLTLVFGATAFATSTILASFFAGLALGSFHFGRVIDKGRDPLKVYAYLEAGIAVFAFLMPLLFAGLDNLYVGLSHVFDLGFFQLTLFRFALSFLVLLVPATLMGGTLPVITKFFVQRQERLGWNVGQLYSTNTFGGVAGTLSAGFFFILIMGVKESAYLAGLVNFLIAGTALALAWRLGIRRLGESHPKRAMREPEERRGEAFSSKGLWRCFGRGFWSSSWIIVPTHLPQS
jgi:spermidine synthase